MKRGGSVSKRLFWIFEALCGVLALAIIIIFGFIWNTWESLIFYLQTPLHLALLGAAVRMIVIALSRNPEKKPPRSVRAVLLTVGFIAVYLLTLHGSWHSFSVDDKTGAVLSETQQLCDAYCAEKEFTGSGVIYNDGLAETRTAQIYRLPQDEKAAKSVFRRLAAAPINGYGVLAYRLPFTFKGIDLNNGYALVGPLCGIRIGTVPFNGCYEGYVFLHGPEGNYCIEFTSNTETPWCLLLCTGPKTKDLNMFLRGILEDPGSFYLSPTDDPALK